mgnify:FL=1
MPNPLLLECNHNATKSEGILHVQIPLKQTYQHMQSVNKYIIIKELSSTIINDLNYLRVLWQHYPVCKSAHVFVCFLK